MEDSGLTGILIGGGIGLGVVIIWLWLIIDIVKSEFKDGYMKLVWLLLAIFLPVIAVLTYPFLSKKVKKAEEAINQTGLKLDDLERLKTLLDSGAISQEEFEQEKAKLMNK